MENSWRWIFLSNFMWYPLLLWYSLCLMFSIDYPKFPVCYGPQLSSSRRQFLFIGVTLLVIQSSSFFGMNFWFCSWNNQSCLAFFGGMQLETTVYFNFKEWIRDFDREIRWKCLLQICACENLSPLSAESLFSSWTISENYLYRGLTLKIIGCDIEIPPFEVKFFPICSMGKCFLLCLTDEIPYSSHCHILYFMHIEEMVCCDSAFED